MPKKRHKPEEIVTKLRQVDVEDDAHPGCATKSLASSCQSMGGCLGLGARRRRPGASRVRRLGISVGSC